jgi:predicted negative regulator of RcsB-dependent stress response
MKIEKIRFPALRNEEHTQLMTDLVALLEQAGPAKLNVEQQVVALKQLLADENQALLVVRKSAMSDLLVDADIVRDDVFRGVADAVKSAINHFNPDKQAAAKRMAVVLGQYGNVAVKPYNDETMAISKLVAEANGALKADIALLGLADWMVELDNKNKAFDQLMKGRFTEESLKTDLKMRQVRLQVDTALRQLIDRINALVLINGPVGYETLVAEMNARFDKLDLVLSQRQGRAAKNKTIEEVK